MIKKNDILGIRAGETLIAMCESYKKCVSAQKYAYELAKAYPREDVERYSTSIDSKRNVIRITAKRREPKPALTAREKALIRISKRNERDGKKIDQK